MIKELLVSLVGVCPSGYELIEYFFICLLAFWFISYALMLFSWFGKLSQMFFSGR